MRYHLLFYLVVLLGLAPQYRSANLEEYCEGNSDCTKGLYCTGHGGRIRHHGDGNLCCHAPTSTLWSTEQDRWVCNSPPMLRSGGGTSWTEYVAGVYLVHRQCDCTDGKQKRLSEQSLTLSQCAEQCRTTSGCNYFMLGFDNQAGQCFSEQGCAQCSIGNYNAYHLDRKNMQALPGSVKLISYASRCADPTEKNNKFLTVTDSLEVCASHCQRSVDCEYFTFGYGQESGQCLQQASHCGEQVAGEFNLFQVTQPGNMPPGVRLIKTNARCADISGKEIVMKSGSLYSCARQCAEKNGECRYFMVANSADDDPLCYWADSPCNSFVSDDFDVYELDKSSITRYRQRPADCATQATGFLVIVFSNAFFWYML